MTFLQIQDLALSWLDDLNAEYFTRPQMRVWVNNAQRECQKELIEAGENFYTIRVSTSTVASTEGYVLPTSFLKLHKLEVVMSGTGVNEQRATLSPATLVQIDKVSTTTGLPEAYVIKKNCLILRPIPDTVYTLYMHYSPLVTDMSADTDVPDVPTQYQEYLAILAALDGYTKDDRESSQMERKRQMYLQLMQQDSESRHVDAPRSVLVMDDLEGGYLF